MGVLSIVLKSALPVGEKLSAINELSIVYSWFNLGGKMLKATALPRLWDAEKDIRRKLGKLPIEGTELGTIVDGDAAARASRFENDGADGPSSSDLSAHP